MLDVTLSVLTKPVIQNYLKEKDNPFQVNRLEAVETLPYHTSSRSSKQPICLRSCRYIRSKAVNILTNSTIEET